MIVSFAKVSMGMLRPMNRMTMPNIGGIAPRSTENSGFTLVELVVVCTIVGILLAVGVPSFKYVTTANRVSSEINGLLGDLQFARAEAIKQGLTVSVCASSDGATCLTTGNAWQSGWLVFTDSGTQGIIDGTDQILRVQRSFTGTDTLLVDNSIKYVSFNRDGFMMNLTLGATFTLHDASATAQYTRCLSATIVGAMSTQRSAQTTAENALCT
jgi:type IV fimbrial biogenesis protein FimT